MLNKAQLLAKNARDGTTVAALLLSAICAPLQAMEEITVSGDDAAAEVRAQDARFRSEMDHYIKTVELRFKADLEFDLKQAVSPPLRVASVSASHRG